MYSVLHCFLSAASVTFGWPFGAFGVVLRFAATHFLKSGGSGTTTAWPGACGLDFAVIASHCLKSRLGDRAVVDLGDGVAGDAAAARGEDECRRRAAQGARP